MKRIIAYIKAIFYMSDEYDPKLQKVKPKEVERPEVKSNEPVLQKIKINEVPKPERIVCEQNKDFKHDLNCLKALVHVMGIEISELKQRVNNNNMYYYTRNDKRNKRRRAGSGRYFN